MLFVSIAIRTSFPGYNLGIGWLCEGCYCEEAQDGYAAENNIELED